MFTENPEGNWWTDAASQPDKGEEGGDDKVASAADRGGGGELYADARGAGQGTGGAAEQDVSAESAARAEIRVGGVAADRVRADKRARSLGTQYSFQVSSTSL